MKRKVLPLLMMAIIGGVSTLHAQVVSGGDILLGATMGFNNSNNTNPTSSGTNANISPRIGFGVGNNNVLGIRTNFGYTTIKSDGTNNKVNITVLGAGLYMRHYMPIKNRIGWYLEGNAGIASRTEKNKSNNGNTAKSTSTDYSVAAVPGIYYQALPTLIINVDFGGVGFTHSRGKYNGNPGNRSSNVYLTLMNSFTFGVDFVLGKKS